MVCINSSTKITAVDMPPASAHWEEVIAELKRRREHLLDRKAKIEEAQCCFSIIKREAKDHKDVMF